MIVKVMCDSSEVVACLLLLQVTKALIDMENMFELLATKPRVQDDPDAATLQVSSGTVEFKQVWCSRRRLMPSPAYALAGHEQQQPVRRVWCCIDCWSRTISCMTCAWPSGSVYDLFVREGRDAHR